MIFKHFCRKIILIIKNKLKVFIRPYGKEYFLSKLKKESRILDVGCGNNSPLNIKHFLPKCYYIGIDISEYNQSIYSLNAADHIYMTSANLFSQQISKIPGDFDAIISSHNLEHCNKRIETLIAMTQKLAIGGRIYLSFPCEESISFPSRKGTLNYYDDKTHKDKPPNFSEILKILKNNNINIVFCSKNYKPFLLNKLGFLTDPFSNYFNKVILGVWEKWGFESIIIGERKS